MTMRDLLIACGDVEILKQLISHIPQTDYKPIATKRQRGLIDKLQGRGIQQAIVHQDLEDGPGRDLVRTLSTLRPAPRILYLTATPAPEQDDIPFTRTLQYPIPAPVFRRALAHLDPHGQQEGQDAQHWRQFYRELKERGGALEHQSYYDILGLHSQAPHHQVVAAFDSASVRYHPDRYAQLRSSPWGEAIWQEANRVYKAMTEAYGVISDKKARTSYDQALAEGALRLSSSAALKAKASGPQSLEMLGQSAASKKFLRLAQTDVVTQNWPSALQNLRFALSMEPGNEKIAQEIAQIESRL